MSNSTSNTVSVVKAGNIVGLPEQFESVITSAIRVTKPADEDNNTPAEDYIAVNIKGLPTLRDKSGRVITILRTVKQAKKDLLFLGDDIEDSSALARRYYMYAVGQPVSLMMTAHEAGALITVNEFSKEHKSQGGSLKTGETYPALNAGFYVEGFLEITFDKADIREFDKEQSELAMKAKAGAW